MSCEVIFSLQLEEQILGEWTKVISGIWLKCFITRMRYYRFRYSYLLYIYTVTYIWEITNVQMVLNFKNVCVAFSAAFRYGGISVGGQLPVLTLQPQTIQEVAAQLGQLLNVTGVRSQNWCALITVLVLYLCGVFWISGPRVNTPDRPWRTCRHSSGTWRLKTM